MSLARFAREWHKRSLRSRIGWRTRRLRRSVEDHSNGGFLTELIINRRRQWKRERIALRKELQEILS